MSVWQMAVDKRMTRCDQCGLWLYKMTECAACDIFRSRKS